MKINFRFPALLAFGLLAAIPCSQAASNYSVLYAFATLAGDSSIGSNDGPGNVARFQSPRGIALDKAGNLYVADAVNQTIRKITPAGMVSTLAGTAGVFGVSTYMNGNTTLDGTGAQAVFSNPEGIAVDPNGIIYVTDKMAFLIRRITPEGVVTTVAGAMSQPGSTDGTGSAARFHVSSAAVTDAAGNLYITDWFNNTVRKVTPAGVVTTIAGKVGVSGSADGPGDQASFFQPMGIAIDSAGALYVADAINNTLRKIAVDGTVSTIAGKAGVRGSADGAASDARFNGPMGVAVDSAGNIFIGDTGNSTIRKLTPGGVVSTIAGTAMAEGSADGNGASARFRRPVSLVVDGTGTLFVADSMDNTIRKISPGGTVTTLAGLGLDYGFGSNDGTNARFDRLGSTAIGPGGEVYVADTLNATIRKVGTDGVVSTLAGKPGARGHTDGASGEARFEQPYGIAVDSSGNIFISDPGNDTIRKISPAGVVSTIAGDAGAGAGYADGTGAHARFSYPFGLAVDSGGNVYVADADNFSIRKINPSGEVSTLAGRAGSSGSIDGTGANARFVSPAGLCIDANGNILVTDSKDQTIRKITPAGVVTTLAGKSGQGGSTDGDAADARFFGPSGIVADTSGAIFVADAGNHLVRRISVDGKVSTLGGLALAGGYANGLGIESRFQSPPGLSVNAANGKLYITSGATLRVGQAAGAATITTQPQSVSCKAGESAQFSVVANGVPAPTYQWYRGATPLAGATAASLSLANVQAADAADYSVVVSNPLGNATSMKASLTVMSTPTPPTPAPSTGGDSSSGGGGSSTGFVVALTALILTRVCSERQRL